MTFADTLAELAKGAGLLLAVSYFISLADYRLRENPQARNIVSGLLFGVAAIIGMSFPLQFTPGVIFDARSVVIGVGGAFGGPVVAAVSSLIAATYRLSLGGNGAWVGLGVIVSAAVLGTVFWLLRKRNKEADTPVNYLIFGFLLHIVTVGWFAAIPQMGFADVMRSVGLEMLLVFTPATMLMCLLLRDSENRAAHHRALVERDADYRRIIDNMVDAFYRADRDGCLTMVSPSAMAVLGYMPGELIGRNIVDLYYRPEERERFLAALAASGGKVHDYETSLKAKDGREVRVSTSSHYCYDESGEVSGVEGTVRDISERRQAEERLRGLAERLSLATNAGGLGIWDRDIETGTIVWDRRMCEMYGIDKDGYTGPATVWKNAIHPDDKDWLEREIDNAAAGKGPFNSRFRVIWPDGSVHHIEARGLLSEAIDGSPARLIGINRDVTEEVEAESRFMQSQKLEAVGQLTGGVAHDFNNLLAVVLGNLEFMDDHIKPGSPMEALKDGALKATLRGAELTQRLLAFSRRQTLSPSRIDANDLVTDLAELLRRTLGENIEIECDLANKVDRILIDPGQLENALLNLAINARDAMPDGGRLRIATENAVLGPNTGGDSSKPGPYVMVSISDTGTGMSKDVRDRIFEPFFTTKEVGKGSGLGLSMVYGFIRQSGGHVTIDSAPGQGTTIRLYLPRAKGVRRKPRVARPLPVSHPHGNEYVLVVEDDPDVRDFVVASLEKLGYRVSSAADGPEALAKLDNLPPLDLLITDVIMPKGMNGKEVADTVRERHPKVRILYTSGYAQSAVVETGERVTFLPKPYKRAVLAQTVRQLLDAA